MSRTANHLLHARLGSEGYWGYRLECLPEGEHYSYTDKPCECGCEFCLADDHGGCAVHGGRYIEEIGYECSAERVEVCWVHDWLDNIGAECIHGDKWPENSLPLPVDCDYDGGLAIHFADVPYPSGSAT